MLGCEALTWAKIATIIGSFVAYMILEYWVGKTQKTRASSVLELMILGGMILLAVIFKRREEKK